MFCCKLEQSESKVFTQLCVFGADTTHTIIVILIQFRLIYLYTDNKYVHCSLNQLVTNIRHSNMFIQNEVITQHDALSE